VPLESGPHARTYVAFGASTSIWTDWNVDVQNAIGLLARTIAAHEPVTVLCRSSELGLARSKCGSSNTTFLTIPLDDIWVRDTGPVFVTNSMGELGASDFNFNGWGKKQTHAQDAGVSEKVGNYARATHRRFRLTGEGGGIEVDGRGTAILCESSWLNSNRNPGWTKSEMEAELEWMLGTRKIIWLPGIEGKDITDGHVDLYARFVKPGVVIANLENNPASHDYQVTRAHLNILQSATDADGKSLQVHTLPSPSQVRRTKFSSADNPHWLPGYVNYYAVNGAVLVPQFGDAMTDTHAKTLLSRLYPGRKVIQLDIDAIAGGGGGIHCVTCHQPRI
jgi:agmatine deiminase